MTCDKQDVDVCDQLFIAHGLPVLVTSLHKHTKDVVGRALTALLDFWQQQGVKFAMNLAKLPVKILVCASLPRYHQNAYEQFAEAIYLWSDFETGQRRRRYVKGDLPGLVIDVDLACFQPCCGTLMNNADHQREIAIHVADREGRVHHLAVPGVLLPIHAQKPAAKHIDHRKDGAPANIIGKLEAVVYQHKAIGFWPDQIHDFLPEVGGSEDRSTFFVCLGQEGSEPLLVIWRQLDERNSFKRANLAHISHLSHGG